MCNNKLLCSWLVLVLSILSGRAQTFTQGDPPFLASGISGLDYCGTIPPTLVLQVKSTTGLVDNWGGTSPTNNAPMKIWQDQTANHFDLQQLGGASMGVTYVSSGGGSNNTPYIKFAQSNNSNMTNNVAIFSQANSYIMVWQIPNEGIPGYDGVAINSSDSSQSPDINYDHTGLTWHMFAGVDRQVGYPFAPGNGSSPTPTTAQWQVSGLQYAGTNSLIWWNGQIVTAFGNSGTNASHGITLNTLYNGTSPLGINMQEFRWYTGAIFCTNTFHNIMTNIAASYGLYSQMAP